MLKTQPVFTSRNRLFLALAAALGFLLAAGAFFFTASAQEDDPPPPDRRVITYVADEGYLWWLKQWEDNETVCEILIPHDGLPTWEEVSKVCGEDTFEAWRKTKACRAAVRGGDTKTCKGLFLLFAGYLEGERAVVEELPKPSVALTLEGCDEQNLSNLCVGDPTLVLTADEPLADERIVSITAEVDDDVYECKGYQCRIPLAPYKDQELKMTFWAESTYGDRTDEFSALVRASTLTWPARPGSENWQIEVLSTQWIGAPPAACSLTWGSFPPIDPEGAWLTTPEDASGLATDRAYDLLAGQLLRWGFVEAPDCPWDGLLADGTASQCGVDATRAEVETWQNRFDERIFQVAQRTGLPAELIKRIFALESQFWPGQFPNLEEYGLGGLHPEGGDTLLLWNVSFYNQLCPLVLSEDYCALRYHELGDEEQELLRGALAIQADVSCPTCPNGIDLDRADESVDLFGNLILANCSQTGEIVRQTYRKAPGEVASYTNLWRFTLANYNAGSGCLYEAVDEIYFDKRPLDWINLRDVLLSLQACEGAVEYVERITGRYP
ncbi:MAG: hypothetical protein P1P76_08625 [Anaerolineales bacterium]|nr:hypothetical protein [Anaerolineales bacterium]